MNPKFKKLLTLVVTAVFLAIAASILVLGKSNPTKIRKARIKAKKTSVVSKKSAAAKPAIKITAAPKKVAQPVVNEDAVMKSILESTTGLQPKVLKLGLNAYKWAEKKGKVKKAYLTIINFSIISKNKRMWIINMKTNKVVLKTLVANGKDSGLYKGVHFSNAHGSDDSSLGVYVTGVKYYGGDGLSLHVHGLQPGINTNAYSRTIEFHGAWYVSSAFAAKYGRVGRSLGCFALDKAVLAKVVKTIKDGSVVFAYAKNHKQDFTVEGA